MPGCPHAYDGHPRQRRRRSSGATPARARTRGQRRRERAHQEGVDGSSTTWRFTQTTSWVSRRCRWTTSAVSSRCSTRPRRGGPRRERPAVRPQRLPRPAHRGPDVLGAGTTPRTPPRRPALAEPDGVRADRDVASGLPSTAVDSGGQRPGRAVAGSARRMGAGARRRARRGAARAAAPAGAGTHDLQVWHHEDLSRELWLVTRCASTAVRRAGRCARLGGTP